MSSRVTNLLATIVAAFGIGPKATRATLDTSGLTAPRTFLFPDGAGTFAISGLNQTIAGNWIFTGFPEINLYTSSPTNPARVSARKARGTIGSPSATQSGDLMAGFYLGGYGTTFILNAGIQATATQNFNSTDGGTKLQLLSTPLGSQVRAVRWEIADAGHLLPFSNNTFDVGNSSVRVREYFGVNGTINTSDADHKTEVRPLTDAEIDASCAIAREIGAFKWLQSIDDKGYDAARWHVGLTVQRAIQIMESFGLDPFAYSFICYDEWDEVQEVKDEDGSLVIAARAAGHIYSFRPDGLMKFLARGFVARMDRIEQRLGEA